MVQSGDTLVLSLAELLGGKQVDTGVIDRALAELCSAFDFDGGLIYELDQYNHLHLKERFLRKELPLRGQLSDRRGRRCLPQLSGAGNLCLAGGWTKEQCG